MAQPITFESMARARLSSQCPENVELLTSQFEEDKLIIPDYFRQTPNLSRSILDIGRFKTKKKLPFIKDILDEAYNASTVGDYIIYSNADIAIQPYFYDFIFQSIEGGLDSFVINRRTISKKYQRPSELTAMYSEIGEEHPGFDCFIFPRESYSRFVLGKTILGANWIGRVLILNLIAFTKSFRLFSDRSLTFHIGDDRTWKSPENLPLDLWNFDNLKMTIGAVQRNETIVESKLAMELIEKTAKTDAFQRRTYKKTLCLKIIGSLRRMLIVL